MQDKSIKKRLVGDLDCITVHLNSIRNMHSRNGKLCRWCGILAFTFCDRCPDKPALHLYTTKGAAKGKGCALHYHNSQCYGLGRCDAATVKLPLKQWREPTKRKMQLHSDAIDQMCKEIAEEDS